MFENSEALSVRLIAATQKAPLAQQQYAGTIQ
jgi:hypothetical protein